MKLLTFVENGTAKLGVVTGKGVVDVAAAGGPGSVIEAIKAGSAAVQAIVDAAPGSAIRDEASLTFAPAVPDPGKIVCIGLNYAKHAAESGAAIPTHPVIFSKFNNTLAANGEDIPLISDVANEFDWEVELAVIMGKTTRNVSESSALDYVYGYATANDLSTRDLQTRTSQWLLGKSSDKFFPLGPYVVTADEVGDPQKLALTTKVNGELRQDSNTSDMIFTVAHIISYISQYLTLEAGDIIITGTPQGVAMGMPNKPWLKAGDVTVVEVEKLGALTNKMV